jgi:hypothetical protein
MGLTQDCSLPMRVDQLAPAGGLNRPNVLDLISSINPVSML